ncbi:carbohydrate ABC transporter permease [Cohnella terricola]|uniref:Carbohydrate ABC transporter permease n=1 Tax=Cohnella terricola TaxID=1289167 RepID=A0A559JN20_9BACL|nr:carbohydrate ABC transporter permease [Cohnella terricola]TVY01272.1 carbohydrate ABC transporter permease [Cohnella terricola]
MRLARFRLSGPVLYLISILWALVTLYPLVFTVMSSFKTTDEIYSAPFKLPSLYSFSNYAKALFDAGMLRAIGNSFGISIVSTLSVILLGSLASFVLARLGLKFGNAILLYFLLGIMIPIHTTLIPLMKMVSSVNGHNHYLTLILIYTAFHLPFAIFLISSHMRGISKELDESATLDGCGPIRLFASILFPLTMPAIATAFILTFLYVYNDLVIAVIFISDKSMFTIPLTMLTFVARSLTEYGPIFASIVVSIIPMVIVFLAFQERVVSGLAAGAVKE